MFASHGQFYLCVEGNTIQTTANGPFNSEAITHYQADIIDATQSIQGNWGQITKIHSNCLFTPDAIAKMHDLTQLRQELGLIAVAFIFDEVIGQSFLKEQFSNFYCSYNIPCKFFADQYAANNWILGQLATQ